ncbi:MAG: A/G-specific adenine glycosylase, partial [Alphaproteobacteria bacterium]
WSEAPEAVEPVVADWREAGAIEHVFTHFSLTLQVQVATAAAPDVIWLDEVEAMAALPTVFAKALVRAGGEG